MDLTNLGVSLTLTPKNDQGVADLANFLATSAVSAPPVPLPKITEELPSETVVPAAPSTLPPTTTVPVIPPSSIAVTAPPLADAVEVPINEKTETIYSPRGIPWDPRIHSSGKSIINSGEWRMLAGGKKPDADTVKRIEAELIANHAQAQTTDTPAVPVAPAVPVTAPVPAAPVTAPVPAAPVTAPVTAPVPAAPVATTKNPDLIKIINTLGGFVAAELQPDLTEAAKFRIDTSGEVLQTVNSFLSAYKVNGVADLENHTEETWTNILLGIGMLWPTPA